MLNIARNFLSLTFFHEGVFIMFYWKSHEVPSCFLCNFFKFDHNEFKISSCGNVWLRCERKDHKKGLRLRTFF